MCRQARLLIIRRRELDPPSLQRIYKAQSYRHCDIMTGITQVCGGVLSSLTWCGLNRKMRSTRYHLQKKWCIIAIMRIICSMLNWAHYQLGGQTEIILVRPSTKSSPLPPMDIWKEWRWDDQTILVGNVLNYRNIEHTSWRWPNRFQSIVLKPPVLLYSGTRHLWRTRNHRNSLLERALHFVSTLKWFSQKSFVCVKILKA